MAGINDYTKLMLHCDGADESTTFIDSSGQNHSITAHGNAQIDTAFKKFGTGACLLDGAGDYLSLSNSSDFTFGTNDFTVDAWIRFSSITNGNIFAYATAFGPVQFFFNGSNFSMWLLDQYVATTSGLPTLNTNQWYHIAFIRESGTFKIYLDGICYGSQTISKNLSVPTHGNGIMIGAEVTAPSQYWSGSIDEVRIQNGEAYWTENFTPPTEAYTEAISVDINETLNLSESWDVETNPKSQNIIETLNLSESWDVDTNPKIKNLTETINLSESWDVSIYEQTDYAQYIVSYNPLIYVTNTDPAKIVHIDISTPESPVKTVYTLTGAKHAIGVVLNDTNDYFYVICDEGLIAKVEKDNLSNFTLIDTSETDTFRKVDSLQNEFLTFAITDNSTGEIITIDEREIKKLNTDLRWIKQIETILSTQLNTILGKKINTDLRWVAETTKIINTDLRWIKYPYDEINQHPINRTSDWAVKINGVDMVPLNDVQMDSIQITIDSEAERTKGMMASFILNRRHDKLDYDNQGNASQITNKNSVSITIKGKSVFTGKIKSLACNSEEESVTVIAKGTRPTDKRHTVRIPMASVGDNTHLYQCFLHSPQIDEPDQNTDLVIIGSNGLYWTGSTWKPHVENAQTFTSWSSAESYINGVSENNTLFHNNNPEVTNYDENPEYYAGISVDLGTQIEQKIVNKKSLQNTTSLANELIDGEFIASQNWTYFWLASFINFMTGAKGGSDTLTEDLSKEFGGVDIDYDIPVPELGINWNDFFHTDKDYAGDKVVVSENTTLKYLGTTLGSMSTDAWKLTGASYYKQKIEDDKETDLGSYQVGSAPYKIISVKNGKKITKLKYEDRKDGLYKVKDEGYDYEQYAKDVAKLEYNKLKNINGDILPVVSAQIELTIDGYFYYNIGLLTKINITNTTISNIYNEANGFPLSVKTITIDSANMKVILNCSNQKSIVELDEIDEDYPNENSDEYIFPATAERIHRKYDPASGGYLA